MSDNTGIYKWIALAAVGLYVYKVAKSNGGTLAGNPSGININPDRIVDTVMPWVDLHPMLKEPVRQGAKKILHGLNGSSPVRRYE